MDLASNAKENTMKNSMLVCCKLYISESRNVFAVESIERAARLNPEAVIVNKFEDRAYNRVRYTLVSYVVHDSASGMTYSPLQSTIFNMVEVAFEMINLEMHSGAHPRLGVVDHICFHPLARTSLDEAAHLAKLTATEIGNRLQGVAHRPVLTVRPMRTGSPEGNSYEGYLWKIAVPVYLYEAAHPNGKALDEIRRELGYYRPNFMGNQWAGWALPDILPEIPDEGPSHVSRERGIMVIGASPWFDAYNIPILSTDVSAARRIARMVSARGGGLPTVQTMGLVHGEDMTEIACIILEPNRVAADRVQNRVEMLAAEEGLEVEKGYFTDFSQEMIVEKYLKLVSAD